MATATSSRHQPGQPERLTSRQSLHQQGGRDSRMDRRCSSSSWHWGLQTAPVPSGTAGRPPHHQRVREPHSGGNGEFVSSQLLWVPMVKAGLQMWPTVTRQDATCTPDTCVNS